MGTHTWCDPGTPRARRVYLIRDLRRRQLLPTARHSAAFRRCGRPDPADVGASSLHGYARDPEVLAMGALLTRRDSTGSRH